MEILQKLINLVMFYVWIKHITIFINTNDKIIRKYSSRYNSYSSRRCIKYLDERWDPSRQIMKNNDYNNRCMKNR